MFDFFGGKENKKKMFELVTETISDKEDMNLQPTETKILVCGVSNLFLRYREQFHLNVD